MSRASQPCLFLLQLARISCFKSHRPREFSRCLKSILLNKLKELSERTELLRGTFDYDAKKERLEEVNAELEQPDVWNEPERAQALGKERVPWRTSSAPSIP